ncbi:GspE/PulE/PilB domain-containing protein [Hyalangium versicolor]|uniref:GspE/PulE/PilB domain-containing protein n=1 Tax=Hyalangium versicolor TaxID=2861190 RepID=UPI001CCD8DF0|nr:pilus assembly protein PilB [Hyalangium versicolor]
MRLGEWFVHNGALTPEQVETVLAYQSRWKCKFGEAVLSLNVMPREVFLRLLAGHLNVPFIRSEQMDKVPASVVNTMPAEVLARLRICPLRLQQTGSRGSIIIATHQPENLKLIDEVTFATGLGVQPVLAFPEDIERTLRRHGILAGRHVEPIELPPEDDFRVERGRYP